MTWISCFALTLFAVLLKLSNADGTGSFLSPHVPGPYQGLLVIFLAIVGVPLVAAYEVMGLREKQAAPNKYLFWTVLPLIAMYCVIFLIVPRM
ncbi:hypothetical protein [Aeoliella mucimassa]|uniref:Uncharacterized protein n=1 Tax=Aeoliella mucimassa TaxID=2527972 RepID=A0A518AGZ4_9BACT|nr:hypothetical protein [Aeoliella mucimassa]QDU54003.1 hypothetical protein Pan181_01830 [Aeoliella mucimassa]